MIIYGKALTQRTRGQRISRSGTAIDCAQPLVFLISQSRACSYCYIGMTAGLAPTPPPPFVYSKKSILSYPVLSCPVPSRPVPSRPVPSRPVPSRPVPSRPVPSRPLLSYPILSYPILSYPILSCPILSYLHICNAFSFVVCSEYFSIVDYDNPE